VVAYALLCGGIGDFPIFRYQSEVTDEYIRIIVPRKRVPEYESIFPGEIKDAFAESGSSCPFSNNNLNRYLSDQFQESKA
jgi:hypothetical protein